MIIRGTNAIRGIRGINTKPGGPISESNTLLRLYQLATEKEHLMKKLQWVRLQKDLTERRLSEIARTRHGVEKRAIRESVSHTDFHRRFIEY